MIDSIYRVFQTRGYPLYFMFVRERERERERAKEGLEINGEIVNFFFLF